ncbi:MAG: hypothetical protein JKY61_05545 [Planctomycetes bacterium]|nr:hypothetical protein [Planctomycetota bacterium]
MKLFLLAASAVLTSVPSFAQCATLQQDFESFPIGTIIAQQPGWIGSSVIPATVEFGSGTNTTNVVRMESNLGGVISRNIPNSIRSAFKVKLDVKVSGADSNGNVQFQIDCPFNPMQTSVRGQVFFDTVNFEVRSGANPSMTLPLNPDFTTLEVIGDTTGLVTIFYGGVLLDQYPWVMANNPCAFGRQFTFIQPGSLGGGVSVLEFDNVCMDPIIPGVNYCQANVNSTGAAAVLSGSGSSSLLANNLILTTTSMPSNSFSFFIVGSASAFVPNPGGSQGNLCVGGSPARYLGTVNSGSAGQVQLNVNLLAIPRLTGTVAALVGETWYFQNWYRDSIGGQAVSNFSDGYSVLVTQ